jgi:hypothetical protein
MTAVNGTCESTATFVTAATMLTLKGPVTAPALYSSQPMEGGLAQSSPSMSVPVADPARPAPRQGELALNRLVVASCGSSAMFPDPLIGSGVVQQLVNVEAGS